MTTMRKVRLGHAIGHPKSPDDPVVEACELLSGARELQARPPQDPDAVREAELALRIDETKRPIYAYVGCLHPDLGRIGLVVSRSWALKVTGLTRCDSGGLAGRRGAFIAVADSECLVLLVKLSYLDPQSSSWEAELEDEVARSFERGTDGYVGWEEPKPGTLGDARDAILATASPPRDRRLWTWEMRLSGPPELSEIEAVFLSPEAHKEYEDLVRTSGRYPAKHIDIRAGRVGANGVIHFNADEVTRAFLGVV